jgi:hypothetical protein
MGVDIYPNPSSGTVTVNYSLPSKAFISLHIVNSLGQETMLKENEESQAGVHTQIIDNLSPGIFFVKLSSLNYSSVTKVIVIK